MPFLSGRRRQRRSTRTADRLNLWPSLGATAPHEFKIFGILPLDHGFMKARARLATSVPVGNAMSLSNHADNVQVFQPREIGGEGDIRQTVLVAGEPLVLNERFFHLIEEQDHSLDCNNEVFRVSTLFNYFTSAFEFVCREYCYQHIFHELAAIDVIEQVRKS